MLSRFAMYKFGTPLVMGLLILPFIGLNQMQLAAAYDNGFAQGAYYQYGGSGISDFSFYFYNNGFSTSNNNPADYVLTASSATGVSYQIGINIFNNNDVIGNDEAWNISTGQNLFTNTFSLSGIPNGWHTIELKMLNSGGNYYVGYYLDGTWHNSYSSTSAFDNEQVPNVVAESGDTLSSDWAPGYNAYGYLEAAGTQEHTFFYGGAWGVANAGCGISYQTTNFYVGSGVETPGNVGTTGNYLEFGSSNEIGLGHNEYSFSVSDPVESSEYTNFGTNTCASLKIS